MNKLIFLNSLLSSLLNLNVVNTANPVQSNAPLKSRNSAVGGLKAARSLTSSRAEEQPRSALSASPEEHTTREHFQSPFADCSVSDSSGGYGVRRYSPVVKRVMDLVLVVSTIPIWVPVCAVVGCVVAATSSGPVFFTQRRIGKKSAPIGIWKFRTMRVDAEECLELILEQNAELREEWETNRKLRNDPRVTTIGAILRRTSLDELPQLLNVLLGHMSLVGPRPLPEYHLCEAPTEFALVRQSVLPGLTGLWQVRGRSGVIEEMVQHDMEYLQRRSLVYDVGLILRTLWVVLRQDGAV